MKAETFKAVLKAYKPAYQKKKAFCENLNFTPSKAKRGKVVKK